MLTKSAKLYYTVELKDSATSSTCTRICIGAHSVQELCGWLDFLQMESVSKWVNLIFHPFSGFISTEQLGYGMEMSQGFRTFSSRMIS